MKIQEHPFSWQALIRILLMGIIVSLAWQARGAFIIILIAIVMALSLHPIVKQVNKITRLPMIFSIFFVLIILLVPFIILGFIFIPILIKQFPDLLTSISSIISHLSFLPPAWANFNIEKLIQDNFSSLLASTQTIASSVFSITTIVIMTVYFIYEFDQLLELLLSNFSSTRKTKLKALLLEIAEVTGKYIRGNLTISFICGAFTFIGLSLLDIPFALPLAIFAGILDLLPIVGQSIGAIPAIIIGFGISPIKGIMVLILTIAYQQLENAFIAPSIYKNVLKLYPAIIIVSVVIGGSLFGILGAFLALPVAAVIPILLRYNKNK